MKKWVIDSEVSSIVLVGNMTPIIFHPEWLISNEIVSEWNYQDNQNDFITSSEITKIKLQNERTLMVTADRLVLSSSRATEFLTLSDMIISIFSLLRETPIRTFGMNYNAKISIKSKNDWMKFGKELAPHSAWEQSIEYFNDLDNDKKIELGLWELEMNLPRPDDLNGYLRPKIEVNGKQSIAFSINNHINVKESSVQEMIVILENSWENSISLAKNIIEQIMESQLSK